MKDIRKFLKEYDGRPLRLMEVCGTHTAQIAYNGIKGMLSPSIRLISGPGCPVCVTVTDYIDRLAKLATLADHVVVSFGDMLRVPGSHGSLNDAKAAGGRVRMVYSPLDMIGLAEKEPDKQFVFAAVGFETTAPIYALLLSEAEKRKLKNIRLLTSLKVMPPVIDWVCRNQGGIDGFLAPGHVCVVTGSGIFEGLAKSYGLPFVVAGFEGEQLLLAIAALVKLQGKGVAVNLYPSAVTPQGNRKAWEAVEKYFMPADAAWRGMGVIPSSGLLLRPEYAAFDAGSAALINDKGTNPACCCDKVLTGRLDPCLCPLFGKVCTPHSPQGACMVSMEGSCFTQFTNA